VAVSALEYSKMELSFQQRGHMRAAAIRRGMDDALELVTIINTLFRSVGVVDREQFAAFTQPLLERYPFVQAFNFSRVDHASARRHEADLQRQYPGYVLHEANRQPLARARSTSSSTTWSRWRATRRPSGWTRRRCRAWRA
jgi:CHASE1-domain containing sensor protein